MGRVEVHGSSIQAHALNEGVSDTMISGDLLFDADEAGVAARLDLKTIGSKTPVTEALLDLLVRSIRSQSLAVTMDGEPVMAGSPVVVGVKSSPKLKTLKRLPCRPPKLMSRVVGPEQ